MDWLELVKLLNQSTSQGSIDAKLSAQAASIDAMTRGLEQLWTDYGTLANNHAAAIEHAIRLNHLLAVLVLVVLLIVCAWLWRLERKIKALESAAVDGRGPAKTDFINVS